MPRAEVGTSKYIANRMKSKGLQRLRWYCQVCEKQCRDENGFKCHTQSESHVRQMQVVSANPRSVIEDFSKEFLNDFMRQLRTSHNTKAVQINKFYQEYIANKEHIHMNSTKWPSLTEFAKHLGREGLCKVEDTDKGLHIAWIDNSPEALRRQDAILKNERMQRGDEERLQRQLENQIKKAKELIHPSETAPDESTLLKRQAGDKIAFTFGQTAHKIPGMQTSSKDLVSGPSPPEGKATPTSTAAIDTNKSKPVGFSFGAPKLKSGNVSAAASKKNPLAGKGTPSTQPARKISEAERIMNAEIERKRRNEAHGLPSFNTKRLKTS